MTKPQQHQSTTFSFTVHEWRRIPDAPNYLISSDGRVASIRNRLMRLLKPWRTAEGYLQAKIAGRKRYLHRLVALAFHGEPPPGDIVVHHRSHIRDHNHADNLEYLPRAENNRRRLNTSIHAN